MTGLKVLKFLIIFFGVTKITNLGSTLIQVFFEDQNDHSSISCKTEHHLAGNYILKYTFNNDYKHVSCHGRSIHKCGGVVIYTKYTLTENTVRKFYSDTVCLQSENNLFLLYIVKFLIDFWYIPCIKG